VTDLLLIAVPLTPAIGAFAVRLARTPRGADRLSLTFATITAVIALTASILGALHDPQGIRGSWFILDHASAAFLAVIAVIGWLSALVSGPYLAGAGKGMFGARRARAWYYTAFDLFWAALLALPLVNNLGVAWLLVEATTGASGSHCSGSSSCSWASPLTAGTWRRSTGRRSHGGLPACRTTRRCSRWC
jgi:hydrogenase-4 component F